MTLIGEMIYCYEADDDGMSVHDVRASKATRAGQYFPTFYRQLQTLRPLQPTQKQPPQKQQPSSEKIP